MKILCFHGAGCSGTIMERQLSALIRSLDSTYEWVFVDGDLLSKKAKELPPSVPGPFYAYYKSIDPESIGSACDLLAAAIEDEGPFDGFIGFSQGASVGLSYLVDREINKPDELSHFKWAVFLSCVTAASPDTTFMQKEIEAAATQLDTRSVMSAMAAGDDEESEEARSNKVPSHRIALLSDKNKRALTMEIIELVRLCMIGASDREVAAAQIGDELREGKKTVAEFPRVFHPTVVTQRIRIPTLHVFGQKDNVSMLKQARLMSKLCSSDQTVVFEHSGGHDVPREAKEITEVAGRIERMIQSTQWNSHSWS